MISISKKTGFIVLLVVFGVVAAFFIWCFSTPRLEKVWSIEQKLKTGGIEELSSRQKNILYDTLMDYPEYEEDLGGSDGVSILSPHLDGLVLSETATVFMGSKSEGCRGLLLEAGGAKGEFPFVVSLSGQTWEEEVTFRKPSELEFELPSKKQQPEIVTIKVKRGKNRKARPDLKIGFCRRSDDKSV